MGMNHLSLNKYEQELINGGNSSNNNYTTPTPLTTTTSKRQSIVPFSTVVEEEPEIAFSPTKETLSLVDPDYSLTTSADLFNRFSIALEYQRLGLGNNNTTKDSKDSGTNA